MPVAEEHQFDRNGPGGRLSRYVSGVGSFVAAREWLGVGLLSAVQLLPAVQASALKTFDPKYGNGIRDPEFYLAYVIPNYFKLGGNPGGWGWPIGQYLWLGAAAILAAVGIERFLAGKPRRKIPGWGMAIGLILLIAFLVRQLYVWLPGGPDFASRWRGLIEAGLTLGLFVFLLTALRSSTGRRRAWLTAALLVLVWTDYKVYGTSRAFNGYAGISDPLYTGQSPQGLDPKTYRVIRANPEYRIALDEEGSPFTTELRHWGLTSPQGFAPFLTVQYKSLVEEDTPFQTDRLFYLDPSKPRLMGLLGVRYFVTREGGAHYEAIRSSPLFRLVGPEETYFRVYEYLKARPSFRWESPKGTGEI